MTIYGFDGFVLRKMFRAIFYLLCDVTGPNGHFSTWQKNKGPESGRGFYRVPLNVGSKGAAKRIRSIQVQTASNGLIFKTGR